MPPLRILALCGFSQNASVFSTVLRKALLAGSTDSTWSALPTELQALQAFSFPEAAAGNPQLGRVVKEGPAAEFTFLDPTIVLTKERMSLAQIRDIEKWGKGNMTPRCWWRSVAGTYYKYDDTVRFLHAYLAAHGPFDAVIGFSQGAALTSALAALLAKPDLHPEFTPHPNLKPLKFAIACGGFKPRSETPDFCDYFPLQTPVLHVIGKRDTICPEPVSLELAAVCANSRIEYHDGGHIVPSSPVWANFFTSFITSVGAGGDIHNVPSLAHFEQARL